MTTSVPEGFRHEVQMKVRFADLDALGHLNHAKFLTYMEQARIEYVQDVCGWRGSWESFGMILAKMTVDYKLPVHFGDKVWVYTRCSRMGNRSFDLSYALMVQQGDETPALAAEAVSVLVAYDYQANEAIPVPEDWRKLIHEYEVKMPE